MRSSLSRALGPIGLVGASVGLCLLGATLAFYHPSIQRLGANAESRLTVDYSAEQGSPRFARISASIVAAARADEAALTDLGPDDSAPFVSVVRPAPTSAGSGTNDIGPTTRPQPPTRTTTASPAPPATPTPTSGIIIEVPEGEIPGRPSGTAEPDPVDTATPTPTATPTIPTPSPTATATVPTSTATAAPSPTSTAPSTSTASPGPTKPGNNPKPTRTPGPKKTPPGQ